MIKPLTVFMFATAIPVGIVNFSDIPVKSENNKLTNPPTNFSTWRPVGPLDDYFKDTVRPIFLISFGMTGGVYNYFSILLDLISIDGPIPPSSFFRQFFEGNVWIGSEERKPVIKQYKKIKTEIQKYYRRYTSIKTSFFNEELRKFIYSNEFKLRRFKEIFEARSWFSTGLNWEKKSPYLREGEDIRGYFRRAGAILQFGFTNNNWYQTHSMEKPDWKISPDLVRIIPNQPWVLSFKYYYIDSVFDPSSQLWASYPPIIYLEDDKDTAYTESHLLSFFESELDSTIIWQFNSNGIKISVTHLSELNITIYNDKEDTKPVPVNFDFLYFDSESSETVTVDTSVCLFKFFQNAALN